MGMRLYTELRAISLPELIAYIKQPHVHVGFCISKYKGFNSTRFQPDNELVLSLLKLYDLFWWSLFTVQSH